MYINIYVCKRKEFPLISKKKEGSLFATATTHSPGFCSLFNVQTFVAHVVHEATKSSALRLNHSVKSCHHVFRFSHSHSETYVSRGFQRLGVYHDFVVKQLW